MNKLKVGDRLTVFSLTDKRRLSLVPKQAFIGNLRPNFLVAFWLRFTNKKYEPFASVINTAAARPVATFVIKSLK